MIETKQELAEVFRRGCYAWPGGYPVSLLMSDGDTLCWACFKDEYGAIAEALADDDIHSGWKPSSADINWEDPALYCAHCGDRIESAYAEDETKD